MLHRKLILVVLFVLLLDNGFSKGKLVVGYYPSWNKSPYPCTMIPYQNLTHIAHAFIAARTDGTIEVPSGFVYPELILTSHQHGVKVVVSVGGWGEYSARFSPMAADTAARRRFVQGLTAFCTTNGYDGADIDWEYPNGATDRTNMSLLIQELRQAFNAVNPPLLLSMAGPSTNWSGQWYDLASMKDNFDWIGIMTYDYYGSWTSKAGPNAALYGDFSTNSEGWIDYSVGYYNTTRGVPKEKLLIGIPFYGWAFNAASMYGASTGASQLVYTAIAQKIQQGWVKYWDNTGQVPYIVNPGSTQVISYDDTASIATKCAYANNKGVGGAILWALGQDMVGAGQPLLDAVGAGLGLVTDVRQLTATSAPGTFSLSQNYPNPFNSQTRIRYHVAQEGNVALRMYDVLGREMQTLANGLHQPGEYEVSFSSGDIASGVYMYRLTWQGVAISRSLIVLR